jgi:two-component system phosphate regulon response regulator PhoB
VLAQDQPAVVVADDDEAIRLLCRVNLEQEGYRVLEAESATELELVLGQEDVGLVLLDVHFGSDDGVAVARSVRDRFPGVSVALFTGSAPTLPAEARAYADGVLPKPFSLEELSAIAQRLVRA